MNKLIWMVLLSTIAGCSSAGAPTRGYSRTVDVNGKPVLKIECRYVGKEPGDVDNFKSKHDYQRINTDFYELTFENLTANDIVVEGVKYRMAKGQFRGKSSASAESIKRTWGSNVIAGNSKISRANNLVHAKASQNTLFKKYSFRIVTKDQKGQTFTAEIPFVYSR